MAYGRGPKILLHRALAAGSSIDPASLTQGKLSERLLLRRRYLLTANDFVDAPRGNSHRLVLMVRYAHGMRYVRRAGSNGYDYLNKATI